jgi:hypothetical protein
MAPAPLEIWKEERVCTLPLIQMNVDSFIFNNLRRDLLPSLAYRLLDVWRLLPAS